MARDGRSEHGSAEMMTRRQNRPQGKSLSKQVLSLSGWTTPQHHDGNPRGKGQKAKHGTKHGCACLARDAMAVSGWLTPKVVTGDYQYSGGDHSKKALNLSGAAKLAPWPTPMASSPATDQYNEAGNTDSGRKTVALVSGMPSNGSSAATGKSAPCLLNPRFSLWLQGYPIGWASSGEAVIRSIRTRRRRS